MYFNICQMSIFRRTDIVTELLMNTTDRRLGRSSFQTRMAQITSYTFQDVTDISDTSFLTQRAENHTDLVGTVIVSLTRRIRIVLICQFFKKIVRQQAEDLLKIDIFTPAWLGLCLAKPKYHFGGIPNQPYFYFRNLFQTDVRSYLLLTNQPINQSTN